MTLELNQVASQVKAMGQTLADQQPVRDETLKQAQALLRNFSTQFTALNDRIVRADVGRSHDARHGQCANLAGHDAVAFASDDEVSIW